MNAEQALRRLTTGSMIILRGIAWAGEWRETLARWVLGTIAAALALTALALHLWLVPVALLAWMAAANLAAGEEAETADDDEDEDQDDEDGQQLLDADDFAELVHEVADGRNVHLTAIGQRLLEETGRGWDVLALCRAHGITTKPVRVAGADPAVTTGVHRHDLPPLPRPLSGAPVGVVVAGQHDNNNTPTVTPIGQAGLLVKHGPSIRQEARRS